MTSLKSIGQDEFGIDRRAIRVEAFVAIQLALKDRAAARVHAPAHGNIGAYTSANGIQRGLIAVEDPAIKRTYVREKPLHVVKYVSQPRRDFIDLRAAA